MDMYCDKCGKAMQLSPIVFTSYPPTFQYSCTCGNTASSTGVQYPKIEYEFSDEVEDMPSVNKSVPGNSEESEGDSK